MASPTEQLEEPNMAQAEKTTSHSAGTAQNGGINVVTLWAQDSLHGRLEIHGDLRIHGTVECELKVSANVAVDSTADVSATIEVGNVSVRGQVNGNVSAKRRL